jgi:2-polyprenyl-3-methyl-5-hydroxy-6-metoxy-1,4-benzoquinol methylase
MADIYEITYELNVDDNYFCFLTPNSSVLEIGSATGYATKFMKDKFNCNVTCIELNFSMAQKCKLYADKMIIADIEEDSWEDEITCKFDFIVFGDILEHLQHPFEVVSRVKKYLKDTGFILTSIPNIAHNSILLNLNDNKFFYNESGLLDNSHIHFFTRKSIKNLFQDNKLYCVNENNKIIRPCDTELKTYYTQNLFFSIFLINRKDAHVYRYVQKWSNSQLSEINNTGNRISFTNRIYELLYDIGCFYKRNRNISTPKIISYLIHKVIKL